MTRSTPPRFASWLLRHFAFGPHRESLIGDIVEQYEHGKSSMWFLRQALATVPVGSATFLLAHRLQACRALVLAITVALVFARFGSWLMFSTRGHDWFTIVFNLGMFGYCFIGLIVLLLTITSMRRPVSLSLVEHTHA